MNTEEEAAVLAYEQIYDELEAIRLSALASGTPEGETTARRAQALQFNVRRAQGVIRPRADDMFPVLRNIQGYRRQSAMRRGPEFEAELEELGFNNGTVTIYNNNTNFYRSEGQASPRYEE